MLLIERIFSYNYFIDKEITKFKSKKKLIKMKIKSFLLTITYSDYFYILCKEITNKKKSTNNNNSFMDIMKKDLI